MPHSLKDSQEEIAAVKNMSRYADDSVTMNFSQGKLGHNITHEQNQNNNGTMNKKLNLNINSRAAASGVEEFKGPTQADSSSLRISAAKNGNHRQTTSNSQRPSNTGGGLGRRA